MRTFRNPNSPAARRHAVLAAYEQMVNRLHPKAWATVQASSPELRAVKAGVLAVQNIAVLLGCSLREAAGHWLEEAMRPGGALLSGQVRTTEDRLCSLAASVAAFYRLTRPGGHLPGTVLRAVTKDLQIDHSFFNSPNPLPIFEAAGELNRDDYHRTERHTA